MKNSLVIVTCSVNYQQLEFFRKDSIFFAFTPIAMFSLDKFKIPYITPENIYPKEKYRKDLIKLNAEVENIFSVLDLLYEKLNKFPYSYSGNIYRFLVFLGDLLYWEKIRIKMESQYNKFYLLCDTYPKKIEWLNLKFQDLKPIKQSLGLQNKIDIINELFEPEVVKLNCPTKKDISKYVELKILFHKTKSKGPDKLITYFYSKLFTIENIYRHKTKVLVIQGGFEINHLKRYLRNIDFINPMEYYVTKLKHTPPLYNEFSKIKLLLSSFLEKYFVHLNFKIMDLFCAFDREIVGRIGYMQDLFNEILTTHNPKILLYSIGTTHTHEAVTAYLANKKNIPVVYFQHGGSVIFSKNPYVKYIERNIKITKHSILYGRVEAKQVKQNGGDCVHLGSIKSYKTTHGVINEKNKKILYCCGPFPYFSNKDLIFNASDKECYQINQEVIDSIHKFDIKSDIKMHPTEKESCYHYFKMMIDDFKQSKIKILYGIPAESIMAKYELLILDYIATALMPIAIAFQKPIILYIKDKTIINPVVLEDLKQRFYIVYNRRMLEEILEEFTQKGLRSKWSEEIVEKYVYPYNNGSPGFSIAEHIKKISKI